jgi:hypothetical protein
MSENVQIVTDLPAPTNLLKKFATKKVGITALAVVATVAVAYFVKNNVDVEVETIPASA